MTKRFQHEVLLWPDSEATLPSRRVRLQRRGRDLKTSVIKL
jgi:hypothetical protein